MRAYEFLKEDGEKLPENVVKAFQAVADMQRGKPEFAMLRVQHATGGSVLNPVVEHVGDLVHRMTEHADVPYWLEDIIDEKVNRGLRYLTAGYGFERDLREQLKVNKADIEKLKQKMLEYSKEHEKLPVYNIAHYHGREAAVALGYWDWDKSIKHLQALRGMLDAGNYKKAVSSYLLDSQGNLVQYSP